MASQNCFRCDMCAIDFTSVIPYQMHLKGSRHSKKIKSNLALQCIEVNVSNKKDITRVGNTLRCDVCNVIANSSLQLQTHLDGVKHKAKVEKTQQTNKEVEKKPDEKKTKSDSEVNGKSGVVRPLPPEFGEPQPTKFAKFECTTCQVNLNSETQLQQHLSSKKHQFKLEGKPISKKAFKQKPASDKAAPNMVVGVKTLESSFVAGETLQ